MDRQIFEPVEVGGLRLKNRLVRSATWEGVAAPDGGIDEVAYAIYDELARGGVGLIIGGFTSVAGNDRYFDGMMRLHDDALVPQYAKLVDVVHAQGAPILAQLALGGFYRENGWQAEPDAMTVDEIHRVERWFVDAAVRAKAAGFDGVQVHVAHFFFLSRFVSPAVNHRTDEYGGSTENRARIVLNIVRGIHEVAQGSPVFLAKNGRGAASSWTSPATRATRPRELSWRSWTAASALPTSAESSQTSRSAASSPSAWASPRATPDRPKPAPRRRPPNADRREICHEFEILQYRPRPSRFFAPCAPVCAPSRGDALEDQSQ